MEGGGHDVIGAVARIFAWIKRVVRCEVLPDVSEDVALWRRMGGSSDFDGSFYLSRVKQIKNTPDISPGTCRDIKFLGRGLKPRLLEHETDAQDFPLHILVFIIIIIIIIVVIIF